jgi:hypothetical protein
VADARPRITAAATAYSIGVMLLVTAVQPKPSDRIRDPFFSGIWPAFVANHLALGNICPDSGHAIVGDHETFVAGARHDAFNVGMLLGGHGRRSLVPLLGLWLGAAFALWRATEPQPTTAQRTAHPNDAFPDDGPSRTIDGATSPPRDRT